MAIGDLAVVQRHDAQLEAESALRRWNCVLPWQAMKDIVRLLQREFVV